MGMLGCFWLCCWGLWEDSDEDLQDAEVAKPGRQEKRIHSKLGGREERYLQLNCSHHHPHPGEKLSL